MRREKLIVHAKGDHVLQWLELRDRFEKKRGFTDGRNRKKVPRTTNGDVKQLSEWWHREFLRVITDRKSNKDHDKASRARWVQAKNQIEHELRGADLTDEYERNHWFWQEATYRLGLYLQGLEAVPSSASLMIESVTEAIQEGASAVVKVAKEVGNVGERAMHKVKVGLIVAGSVVGAAIILPPVIRAIRTKNP